MVTFWSSDAIWLTRVGESGPEADVISEHGTEYSIGRIFTRGGDEKPLWLPSGALTLKMSNYASDRRNEPVADPSLKLSGIITGEIMIGGSRYEKSVCRHIQSFKQMSKYYTQLNAKIQCQSTQNMPKPISRLTTAAPTYNGAPPCKYYKSNRSDINFFRFRGQLLQH